MDILGPEPGDKAQPWTNLHVVQGALVTTEQKTVAAPCPAPASRPRRLRAHLYLIRLGFLRWWWGSDFLLGGVVDGVGVEFEAPVAVGLGEFEAIGLPVAAEVAGVGDVGVT